VKNDVRGQRAGKACAGGAKGRDVKGEAVAGEERDFRKEWLCEGNMEGERMGGTKQDQTLLEIGSD
jgi:hypothetical protein